MKRVPSIARALFAALLFTVIAGHWSPSTASAQQLSNGGGFDLHLFRPSVDSKGHLSVNGTDILGHLDFSFGLILDYGRGLMPFEGYVDDSTVDAGDEERRTNLLDNYVSGALHFNLGLANWVVIGAQVPIVFLEGSNIQMPDYYNTDLGSPQLAQGGTDVQGVGDIQIHTKIRFLRAERDPIGLAAVLRFTIPTGDSSQFTGEPSFTLWPTLIGEVRPIRQIRLSLEVGARFILGGDMGSVAVNGHTTPSASNAQRATYTDRGTEVEYGHLLTFGFGASFRVAAPLDIVAEVYGDQILTDFGTPQAFALEGLLGLKIFVQRSSYLVLSGGGGLPPLDSARAADWRFMAGFIFEPSIGDRDGDGYKDDTDQCPDEPEDFDNFADEEGCPDPDNDRDGILDVDDDCPLVPEDRDGDADEDGCPEGSEGDRDGDGILDGEDDCPDDPEDRDGFEDEDGCPDPDNDRDGILDQDDLCPDNAEDMDDFEDEDGCPEPDNDHDRILDQDDECPNDPETYNGTEDEDGCPDEGIVVVEDGAVQILEKIQFETDSAVIRPESYHVVDAVAATLIGWPNIELVEIQGHADERGDDNYNIRLTNDRAASVLEALVQRGVERRRLRSAGYGERCPLDPRSTPSAWEQNRRVEFKILQQDGAPTGVEVACPAAADLIPR